MRDGLRPKFFSAKLREQVSDDRLESAAHHRDRKHANARTHTTETRACGKEVQGRDVARAERGRGRKRSDVGKEERERRWE